MRQSRDVETLSHDLLLKHAPGPLRWQEWLEQRSHENGRRHAVPGSGKLQRRNPSSRRDTLFSLGKLCLTSLVYGAAVYGFIVAYLLVLGMATEPASTYPTP